ncbi:lytic transglycosylase domain-containing protein [Filomicrobium sp.]|uniref:lytic transglycosylase domain-containing protein n=1 Tax=Filomicrobium sp. TaxID=2024831 RepID=UPI0025843E10|nr:lytic transglycosylase domain-containing protein [Filomicrobium sp.]MCV0368943.1 lytic transglycosylase domain-containing protein [Filomicrobium sp.]
MAARRPRAAAGRFETVRRTAFLLLSGLAIATPPATIAHAQQASAERGLPADPYAAYVDDAARRFGVPEAWIRAVMRVESRGNVRAISPMGAMGLMQIMPDTWAELRARYGLGSDPFDPRDNILAGAAYLREMHDRYGSPGFLAAYNAGPGRYEDYRDRGRPLPAETRAYVAMLTPAIGGSDLASPVTVAAADPLAWTRAPLFIAQHEGASRAGGRHEDGDPAAASPQRPERDFAPADPQTGGLFAVRTANAGPQ